MGNVLIYALLIIIKTEVIIFIKSLKIKNTEGFYRIPQQILIDGRDSLIEPLTDFFRLNYRNKIVPGQWLVSKIIPVHKKVISR